jgi:integrase
MATVVTRSGSDGKPRYDVRYRDPAGIQRKRSFTRRSDAAAYSATVEADKLRGLYVDRNAGRELFRVYADRWLTSQIFAPNTRAVVTSRLKNHAYPILGTKPLASIRPSTVQAWAKSLSRLAPSTQHAVYGHVQAILTAAVDDQLIATNPCKAPSVTRPRNRSPKIAVWPRERVPAMSTSLPDRYQVVVPIGAGLGLRQGEIFGLAVDDVDFLRREVTVRRQVTIHSSRLVFAPPKYGKIRTVPLAPTVAEALAEHLVRHSAISITLPWIEHDGPPVTALLVCHTRERKAINRNYFNTIWHTALRDINVEPGRQNGCHALRHFFASVLLDAGESIKVVSHHLGHTDPGFTLRTYTHLMPDTRVRSVRAIDAIFSPDCAIDVPSEGRA